MAEVADLMESWRETPPPAIALDNLAELVHQGLTGKPRKPVVVKPVTAEEFAAAIGLKLKGAKSG